MKYVHCFALVFCFASFANAADTKKELPEQVSFNAHIRPAERFLTRLNQAQVDSVASWDTWWERLADGQRRLRVRWGIAEDRARSGSIDSELSRRQIANDDLQKIGQDELTRWRKG